MSDRVRMRAACAAAALALGLCAGEAQAQNFIRAECAPLINQPAPAESSVSGRWYRRFWTGDCTGLKGCFGGSPNWNEVVGKLMARSAPAERPHVLAKACRLGLVIGLEWTRPKDVRRIDTGDLRGFKGALEKAGDVTSGLERVEAQARAKIAGKG